MAPKKKGTPEQQAFIELWMPEFLLKKGREELDTFWPKMWSAYLNEWPEELELDLPLQQVVVDPDAEKVTPLTKEERARLDTALGSRFQQLRNSFYNAHAKIRNQRGGVSRSSSSLAAMLFKARPKRGRRHQCRDDDGEWIDDEDDKAKMARVSQARRTRMQIKCRVVQEQWDAEPDEVKNEVRERAKNEVAGPVEEDEVAGPVEEDEDGTKERTPEAYQMSIDESIPVAEMFLAEFSRMTGWMGALVYGGPVPRAGGKLGIKVVPFGATPEGLTFEKWHPNWKKGVSNPLFRFLRQAVPRQLRLSRGIFTGDNDEEGEDAAAAAESGAETTPVKTTKNKSKSKPKPNPKESTAKASTDKPAWRPRKARASSTTPAASAPTVASEEVASQATVLGAAPSDDISQSVVPQTVFDFDPSLDNFDMSQVDCSGVDLSQPWVWEESQQTVFGTFDHDLGAHYTQSPHSSSSRDSSPLPSLVPNSFTISAPSDGFTNTSTHSLTSSQSLHSSSSHDSSPLPNFMPNTFTMSTPSAGFANTSTNNLTPSHNFLWPNSFSFSAGLGTGALGTPSERLAPQSFGHADGSLKTPPIVPRPAPKPRLRDAESPAFSFGQEAQYRLDQFGAAGKATGRGTSTQSATPPRGLSPNAQAVPSPTVEPVSKPASTPHPLPPPPQPLPSTPRRLSSAPATSSPLSRPPLQAPSLSLVDGAGRTTTPPLPDTLPPRMRPSPERRPSSSERIAPIFPRSRPMANAPKVKKAQLSPGAVAKKMEQMRASKKAAQKKKAPMGRAQTQGGGGAGARGTPGSAAAGGSTVTGEGSAVALLAAAAAVAAAARGAGAEQQPEESLLMHSSTNNNRARLAEEKKREDEEKKEAAARKAENMRLHNPAGDHDLYITQPRRAQRPIQAVRNRGAVISLVDRNRALKEKVQAEDDALLNALEAGKKRRRGATENLVPATKRAKAATEESGAGASKPTVGRKPAAMKPAGMARGRKL
ncbi:hypothetical protein DFH09DRAFT_1072043 [Mycena vulgaris]|nr:hypothetical protein DFH09DRAFT_1072043 [Mycena vulgaris]